MPMSTAPPIVSIAPLLDPTADPDTAATTTAALHEACLETGFFVAVDHGLERPMAELFDLGATFFARPPAEKLAIPRLGQFGFVPHVSEAPADDDRASDHTEYLDLGLADEAPVPDLPGFESAVRRYQAAALEVGAAILRALAVSLDLDPDFFAATMEHPGCKLRFLHYPPVEPDPDGTLPVPTTPHTDYGALTLLATDGVPGLEVKPIGGDWTPVEAPPRSLVVNLGDLLARWTNDRYRSTPHRVVGPASGERFSIPFFVNPDPDTIVECIPSCVTDERPCRYEPVTTAEFLDMRRVGKAEPYVDPAEGPARAV